MEILQLRVRLKLNITKRRASPYFVNTAGVVPTAMHTLPITFAVIRLLSSWRPQAQRLHSSYLTFSRIVKSLEGMEVNGLVKRVHVLKNSPVLPEKLDMRIGDDGVDQPFGVLEGDT